MLSISLLTSKLKKVRRGEAKERRSEGRRSEERRSEGRRSEERRSEERRSEERRSEGRRSEERRSEERRSEGRRRVEVEDLLVIRRRKCYFSRIHIVTITDTTTLLSIL